MHASTGEPIHGLAARLRPMPYGWSVRTLPDGVVVAARAGVAEPPAAPVLAITLTDGAAADLLVLPPVAGQPPRTVVVGLTAAEIDVPLHPVAMTLTVVLTPLATGAPRTGRTVTARARSGPDPKPVIDLPAAGAADPGVYRSAPVEWTAFFTPSDLLVDGTLLRPVSVDLTRTATRMHLVDTT